MVQSFKEFCGNSSIWDLNLLMNSTYPHFTECFQNTLLIWVPCGLLWMLLPFYTYFLFSSNLSPLPLTCLNVSKSFFSLLLFFLSGVDLLFAANDDREGITRYSTAYFVAGSVKAATYLMTALVIQIERMKGVLTSGLLFTFWFLSVIAGIIPFYSLIIQKTHENELFYFSMFYTQFTLLVIQLVLCSFAEKYQRRGYQELGKPQSPEIGASFPSKLSFWWITSLVVRTFRSGIKEDEFWELHPRDKSANFLPGFHDAWSTELDRFRQQEARRQKIINEETSFTKRARSEKSSLINSESSYKKYDSLQIQGGNNSDKKKQEKKNGPSLFKVIVKQFGSDIFLGWLCKLVYDFLQFVNPMILNLLIGYVQSKNEESNDEYEWKGYVYAGALFVVAAVQSVFFHQNFHLGMTAGMRIKAALISAVYTKALTMNSEAKKSKTQGEIVNLMSVDCQRIQDITGYLWMLWSAPLQVTLAMLLLWNTLGISVLSGLGIMILLMPVNALIAMKQRQYQVQQMRFKDQRLKMMSELLNGIKVLKLYAWEPSFEKKVKEVREKELNVLKKSAYLNACSTFFWTSAPFLVTLATFATYILIDKNNQLDAQKAFVSLSLFNILRFPINLLPMIISYVIQGNVSLGRISSYLQSGDLDPNNVEHREIADHALTIENGTFGWDSTSEPTLKDINIDIPDGKLVAVVGQVGAGKSSLISAFLGEMEKYAGRVKVKGTMAYVPQQAWIQNDTVRGNILFSKETDHSKYRKVIEACALQPDLDILQGGDLTEIGEKGINLSGGQKQRVSLARAVYHNADVYLLDDPLSAVDSHVGKHIFNKVIGSKGLLRNKTRILVTHGVHWLPMVDQIIVLVNGKISEMGSYEELLSHDGVFAQFLKTYLTQQDDEEDEDPEVQQMKSKILERVDSVTSGTEGTGVSAHSGDDDAPTRLRSREKSKKPPLLRTISSIDQGEKSKFLDDEKKADKLIEAEKAETGKVSWIVYMKYFSAIGGLATLMIFVLFIIYQGAGIGSSIWLAQWTDDKYLMNVSNVNTTEYRNKNYMYLGIYGIIGVGQAVVILFYAILAATRMVRAAGQLHNAMLTNVLKLPMAFFDTTPLGRVVNRFSRDVETIDNNLPQNFRTFLATFFGALSTMVVIAYSTPLFLAIIIPMGFLYYLVQATRPTLRSSSLTPEALFSRDVETIDNNLPELLRMFFIRLFRALNTFVVIVYSTPKFLAVAIPMGLLFLLEQPPDGTNRNYGPFLSQNTFKILNVVDILTLSDFLYVLNNPPVFNRFAADTDVIDNTLPYTTRAFLSQLFGVISTLVVVAYSTPLIFIVIFPVLIVYYIIQRFYIPTSRQLKRIESTTRSPIYSHFGESISGASTIRGYNMQHRFIEESQSKVDKNLVFYFAGIASNRWLGWRLEILGNIIVFSAAIFAVVTPGNTGGLVGLSISYALQVTGALNFLVRNTSDVETNVVSVERVKEYTEEQTEAAWILPFHRPSRDWPETGNVRFNNYSTRYRDGLDLVLKGISCDITGGERVGIVGRTGAGKSSLTVALFRIIEAAGGSIVVDGERISDMGLHDLRAKLTILPQDPVLFSGTLRMNLDPFDNYTDSKIWQALEHAHLKTFVMELPDGLQHECGEGGQNLSVGQRQLVCLARTLLRKTKILILDEATAAVDMETDDLIQKTIREEFRGCTILTIAHRLNTIMDYDKIMVLDQGLIREFDNPQTLLADSSTIFHGMAKDANLI